MNDTSDRAELHDVLRSIEAAAPQMRIGQIMAALGELCDDMHGRGLWEAEDRELLEAAWKFLRDLEGRTPVESLPHSSATES
jgi:hypothetical protein